MSPTAREVVHHVLIFARTRDKGSRRGFRNDDEIGGFFAAYVPGNDHVIFPLASRRPPRGNPAAFSNPLHPQRRGHGGSGQDRSPFSKAPPDHEVEVAGIADPLLNIPPGAAQSPRDRRIPVPSTPRPRIHAPHALAGKAFRFEVELPGGEEPRCSKSRDTTSTGSSPIAMRIPESLRGSIRATGWFDNSEDNPANPDPARPFAGGRKPTTK